MSHQRPITKENTERLTAREQEILRQRQDTLDWIAESAVARFRETWGRRNVPDFGIASHRLTLP